MLAIDRARVLSSPRAAGMVKRYHTWPVIQEQTVADHTFHVLRIYWQMFGPPAPHVVTAILWHDMGEIKTGDLPFPFKSNDPTIKRCIEQHEVLAIAGLMDAVETEWFEYHKVSPGEQARIKCADLLEMAEFGSFELQLGNRFAQPIVKDTIAAINTSIWPKLDAADRSSLTRYVLRNLGELANGLLATFKEASSACA